LFLDAIEALNVGDFSRIQAHFENRETLGRSRSQIEQWYEEGRFDTRLAALAQAFTCACMLGRTTVAAFILDKGIDPTRGSETGQTGFHYAVSGGHLDTAKLLIERKVPLEVKNMYGGTVLDQALWSAIHEPKPDHAIIIEHLIAAGANVHAVGGREFVDAVLRRHRANSEGLDTRPRRSLLQLRLCRSQLELRWQPQFRNRLPRRGRGTRRLTILVPSCRAG